MFTVQESTQLMLFLQFSFLQPQKVNNFWKKTCMSNVYKIHDVYLLVWFTWIQGKSINVIYVNKIKSKNHKATSYNHLNKLQKEYLKKIQYPFRTKICSKPRELP